MATFFHINTSSYRLADIVAYKLSSKNPAILCIYMRKDPEPFRYEFATKEQALDALSQLRALLEKS